MITAFAMLLLFFTAPILFCLWRFRSWLFSSAHAGEKTFGIALLVGCIYVISFYALRLPGWGDRIDSVNLPGKPFMSLWDFHGPRMRNTALTREQMAYERTLLCFYYPIIRAYRLGGYYHTLDIDLPETGG